MKTIGKYPIFSFVSLIVCCIMTALPNLLVYEEKELMRRFSEGDESALAQIYHRYWKTLFIQAYNILKDRMVCEDIVQDIFIQLWHKRKNISITESLGAYLQASTRYQVFHYIRKNPSKEHLFDNIEQRLCGEPCDQLLVQKDLHERVNEIISRLPEKCRVIYKLSREEYLPHKEIAERLQISIKTVENQLTIALRRLRISLKDAILLLLFIHGS